MNDSLQAPRWKCSGKLARLIIALAKEYSVDGPGGTFKASQADSPTCSAQPVSINLALQQFKNEGLISISYMSLTLIDLPRMCEYAGIEPDCDTVQIITAISLAYRTFGESFLGGRFRYAWPQTGLSLLLRVPALS